MKFTKGKVLATGNRATDTGSRASYSSSPMTFKRPTQLFGICARSSEAERFQPPGELSSRLEWLAVSVATNLCSLGFSHVQLNPVGHGLYPPHQSLQYHNRIYHSNHL